MHVLNCKNILVTTPNKTENVYKFDKRLTTTTFHRGLPQHIDSMNIIKLSQRTKKKRRNSLPKLFEYVVFSFPQTSILSSDYKYPEKCGK